MRRMLSIAGMAGLIALLGGGPGIWAQEKASSGKDQGKGQAAVHCAKSRMGKRLGLTEDQAKKMKEINKSRREAVSPLRKKLQEEMRNLRQLVRDEATDKEIQASLTRLQDSRKSMQAETEKFKGKLEAVLTPSQQAKMLLAMGKLARGKAGFGRQGRGMHQGMRGRRGGWGGGQGGWGEGRGGGQRGGRGRMGGGPGWMDATEGEE
ncbi:MAG: periplasmic heavy metal sensor [Elusimicrobia bacterium]|nr:periplasmic heavy metal sensor [Elusimicrobiota bacterium]